LAPEPPAARAEVLATGARRNCLDWENGQVAGDNVAVVRQALDAVGRRDLPALLKQVDTDVELRPLLTVWPQTYRGHEGIEQWWRDVGELWDDFSIEPEDFRDLGGGTLIVRVRWSGRPKGASAKLDGPAVAVVRFRETKAVSVDIHLDEAHALRAMGGA